VTRPGDNGADDPILPVDNGRALAQGVKGAQLLVLPRSGHEAPLSCVATIAQRVADHLNAIV